MVDFAHPPHPEERLADRDRAKAVEALAHARDEGRLRPDEFGQRSQTANAAVTWADLVPLFADLPAFSVQPQYPDWGQGARRPLGGAWGATIMSVVPFLALGLFFLAGFVWEAWAWAWLFFLIIPVTWLIIYGPGGPPRDRSRY